MAVPQSHRGVGQSLLGSDGCSGRDGMASATMCWCWASNSDRKALLVPVCQAPSWHRAVRMASPEVDNSTLGMGSVRLLILEALSSVEPYLIHGTGKHHRRNLREDEGIYLVTSSCRVASDASQGGFVPH